MTAYRLYVLDLDGTVYRGDVPCPGARETIDRLRGAGAIIRFVTNHSARTAREIATHLCEMGVRALPGEILTSGMIVAERLRQGGFNDVAVAGEEGLIATLIDAGLRAASVRDADPRTPALVAGIWRGLDYSGLDASLQILLNGSAFFATNADATYPMPDGRLRPGAGAIVAALRAASGRDPIVVGKPDPGLIRAAMASANVSPAETLVIGDRPETDLEAGRRAGCATWLVLTGITSEPVPGCAFSADLTGVP